MTEAEMTEAEIKERIISGDTEFIKKLELVIKLYKDFVSMPTSTQDKILEFVKAEYPQLYPAMKEVAERTNHEKER